MVYLQMEETMIGLTGMNYDMGTALYHPFDSSCFSLPTTWIGRTSHEKGVGSQFFT